MNAQGKIISCNVCGSEDFKRHMQCEGFAYVKCENCGLAYQNPQPLQDDIDKMYEEDYFQFIINHQEAFFNLARLGLDDVGIDELMNEFPENKRLLDIGCSTGLLLNHLRTKGWDTYGVEICRQSVDYARNNFDLKIMDKPLEDCGFQKDYFQLIHLAHLIEHVPDPRRLMEETYRVLQPGGYVVITTPRADGLFAKIHKEKWRLAIPDHLYLFSKNNLKSLMEQCGFTLLDQLSWGGIPIQISNGILKKFLDKWIKRLNIGDVMLYLARK